MLYKVYKAQRNCSVKGDWVKLLDEDRKEFGLESITDEDLQFKYTKSRFKSYVKRKAVEISIANLHKLKEQHSKLDDLNFEKLECAQYLIDPRISKREAKLLFRLRTKMFNVKSNYQGKYLYNMTCNLCRSATCDQPHLMQCSVLRQEVLELRDNVKIKYDHLFGSIENIIPAIKLFSAINKRRDLICCCCCDNIVTP